MKKKHTQDFHKFQMKQTPFQKGQVKPLLQCQTLQHKDMSISEAHIKE